MRSVPRNILVAAYDDVAGVVVVGTTGGTVAHLDPTDLSVLGRGRDRRAGRRASRPDGDQLVVVADEEVIRLDDSLSVLDRRRITGASTAAWHPVSGLAVSTSQGRAVELTAPDGERTTVDLTDVVTLAGPVQAELWGQLRLVAGRHHARGRDQRRHGAGAGRHGQDGRDGAGGRTPG